MQLASHADRGGHLAGDAFEEKACINTLIGGDCSTERRLGVPRYRRVAKSCFVSASDDAISDVGRARS